MEDLALSIQYQFTQEVFEEESTEPIVEEYSGRIILEDDDFSKREIGSFRLTYIDQSEANAIQFYEGFVSNSENCRIFEVLFGFNEIKDINGVPDDQLATDVFKLIGEAARNSYLILNEVLLIPEFRRKGLGKKIIRSIVKHFRSKSGYLVLQSFPIQFDPSKTENAEYACYQFDSLNQDQSHAQLDLDKFYKDLGMTPLITSEWHFFVKNLQPVRSLRLQ